MDEERGAEEAKERRAQGIGPSLVVVGGSSLARGVITKPGSAARWIGHGPPCMNQYGKR